MSFSSSTAGLEARVPATFISGHEVRCISPPVPMGTPPHDALLHVRLADAGPTPSDKLQFTYYNPDTPPTIDLIVPDYSDHGPDMQGQSSPLRRTRSHCVVSLAVAC